jgi:hypothetical protein
MPGASREVATALTTDRQIRPLQAEGVLRDVVEDHRAAPSVSQQISFEKGCSSPRYDTETFEFATTAPKRGLGPSVLSGDRHQR